VHRRRWPAGVDPGCRNAPHTLRIPIRLYFADRSPGPARAVGGICNSSEILNSTALVSTCDARYVALAERLAMPLLTDDAKLAGAPGHHADIQHYLG
jgi:hypothetical protein